MIFANSGRIIATRRIHRNRARIYLVLFLYPSAKSLLCPKFFFLFNGTTPLATSQNSSLETGVTNLTQSVLVNGPKFIFLIGDNCVMPIEADKEKRQ